MRAPRGLLTVPMASVLVSYPATDKTTQGSLPQPPSDTGVKVAPVFQYPT